MKKKNEKKNWIPEILYEDSTDGMTQSLPFITVPKDEEMPKILFIFESRETGEIEPGSKGEELPVTEITLHQYADMSLLKAGLSAEEYDNVRAAVGLAPLLTAVEAGRQMSANVRDKIANI
jgi:hypothetical protein